MLNDRKGAITAAMEALALVSEHRGESHQGEEPVQREQKYLWEAAHIGPRRCVPGCSSRQTAAAKKGGERHSGNTSLTNAVRGLQRYRSHKNVALCSPQGHAVRVP
jgi:hypothetical protein